MGNKSTWEYVSYYRNNNKFIFLFDRLLVILIRVFDRFRISNRVL